MENEQRDALREVIINKLISTILEMTLEELQGVSKLFGGLIDVTIGGESKIVPDEDDPTEEETMSGWIKQLISKGGTADSILEFLLVGTEDEKLRLVSILGVLGYQLKPGVEYTEEILKKVTHQALVKHGAQDDNLLDGLTDSGVDESFPEAPIKISAPATSFDYKKVKIVKPVEQTISIDQRINELIIKVGGTNQSEDDLAMISEWNEKYTPQEIFSALNQAWNNNAFSLRAANSKLKALWVAQQGGENNLNAKSKVRNSEN